MCFGRSSDGARVAMPSESFRATSDLISAEILCSIYSCESLEWLTFIGQVVPLPFTRSRAIPRPHLTFTISPKKKDHLLIRMLAARVPVTWPCRKMT